MAIYNGTTGDDTFVGTVLDDTFYGVEGNDSLTGDAGADVIDGGTGADTLIGGTGDDTYYIDNTLDVVTELGGEGIDTVISTVRDTTLAAEVENLIMNAASVSLPSLRIGRGNSLANTITDNDFRGYLMGNAGDDFLYGNGGNDSLWGGSDNDTLDGGTGRDLLYGEAGNDSIIGGDDTSGDLLDGGTGADTLVGGLGNDSYYVDDAGDLIIENEPSAFDRVYSRSLDYTLSSGLNNLTIVYDGDGATGSGNSAANDIVGNDFDNLLYGLDGEDTITGDEGSDTLHGGAQNDYLVDQQDALYYEGGGPSTVDDDDLIYGEDGNDHIVAVAGNDTIYGGDGNDAIDTTAQPDDRGGRIGLYNAGSNLIEGGVGNDSIVSLDGADTLNGDEGDDLIFGYGAGSSLDGGDGQDTLAASGEFSEARGGTGNDVITGNLQYGSFYHEDGEWQVSTSSDWYESGTSPVSLLGEAGDDTLTGGAGASTLDGGADNDELYSYGVGDSILGGSGDDALTRDYWTSDIPGSATLAGGLGDDSYTIWAYTDYLDEFSILHTIVDNITLEEALDEGTDLVFSGRATFTLGDNFEDLTLIENEPGWGYVQPLEGTGNALGNIITGNSANNTLSGLEGADLLEGGTGIDTLIGGTGDDTYYVDNAGDIVTETSGNGTDLIYSGVTFDLTGIYVETVTLENVELIPLNIDAYGNSLANTLNGNDGNNRLDGRSGLDTMAGKLGNDTYVVNATGDIVTELESQGTDSVESSITWTLGDHVENLTLTGTANINATGNALNNNLLGNTGNNALTGGLGADTMTGGLGNDTYYVDNTSDSVVELSGGGTDLINATVTYSLAGRVAENLTLTGTAHINATGNNTGNKLTGNSGNNILDGGIGNDTMTGGLGNDTYFVQSTADSVVEANGEGTDTINSTVTYNLTGRYIETLALTGTSNVDATGNSLTNTLIGNSGNNVLNGLGGTDTLTGGSGADTFLFLAGSSKDSITDFSAAEGDSLNINAYTLGVANAGLVVQSGADVVINLGGNNIITVINANQADVLAHMVW